MNELDNEELVSAFENVVSVYHASIQPHAAQICTHLKQQYIRLIGQEDEDDGESILAAVASFTSMRRILDAVQTDLTVLRTVEDIIYPCLLHSLTADGLDSIEEGIDCITLILYHGYKRPAAGAQVAGAQTGISEAMWKLYPQLLYVCAGADGDQDGGFGFEYVTPIVIALKNYIAQDPAGMLAVQEGQAKTRLELLSHFITRCLAVSHNSSDGLDGVAIMNLLIAILENMQGRVDQDLGAIIGVITSELNWVNSKEKGYRNYKLMVLQALAMCFTYNSALTFQALEASGMTLPVFAAWLNAMNHFKTDFELRRNIFGLSSIITCTQVPAVVSQKLPDLLNQLALLAIKMESERLDTLKDNEEHVAKGGVETDSDADEADGDDVADGNNDEVVSDDSDTAWKETQEIFTKLGPKLHAGKALTQAEMDEFGLDDYGDDDDSDFELNGGDDALYDAAMDEVDELEYLRDTLGRVSQANPSALAELMAGIASPEHRTKFEQLLAGVASLVQREADVTAQVRALEDAKK